MSAVIALANGESVPDAMLSGLADGIFWGGVFAFVTAGVNAVKAGVRAVKNAKPAGSTQTGSQPKSTVNNINDINDIKDVKILIIQIYMENFILIVEV